MKALFMHKEMIENYTRKKGDEWFRICGKERGSES